MKALILPLWFAVLVALAGCAAGQVQVSPSPVATLIPYRTPTATPSPPPSPQGTIAPPTPLASPTPFVHVVKKNDTLLGIALRYGVELNDLLAANPGINPRILSIGQEIVIPGPAGDAEGSFFPTPTPVVFDLGDTRCYWDQSGRLICLSTARNPGPQALESVAAMISLADAAGNPLVSRPAYAPLNLLPAQGVAPLHTVFLGLPRQDIRISAWPLSAFLASDVDKRYLSVAVELGSRRALEGGRAWSVEGDLHLQEEFPEGSARLSVLLVGLDAEGRVVAFRTKVWMLEPGEQGPWPFTLTLISLGPPIESLEAYAEGVILP